jgi:hypothetical protein
MTPWDLVLAVMMLSGTPDVTEADPTVDRWPVVSESLRAASISLGIADSGMYEFSVPSYFQYDLYTMRRRRLELESAPPSSDSFRFPGASVAKDNREFNRKFASWLEGRQMMELDRRYFYQEVIDENDKLYTIWDQIFWVAEGNTYAKRTSLLKLKELLGDNYYYGDLPPAVPSWRFTERK